MKNLEKLISELKEIVKDPENDMFVINFEEKLLEIFELKSPKIIGPLLTVLEDDFVYFEVMFSIIHAIEYFSTEEYIAVISANTHVLLENSPEWAEDIISRILNSDECVDAYIENINKRSLKNRIALKKILVNIGKDSEDWRLKTLSLLAVLNA